MLYQSHSLFTIFSRRIIMKIVAIICNIVLLGFVCWAIVDQYPHPEEDGVIPFAVLTVMTPILTLVALIRSGGSSWLGYHLRDRVQEEKRRH